MAMQPEVRYINAYVSGTCAPQPQKKPQKKSNVSLPKVQRRQKWLIHVDVVALAGIVAAVVLAVLLVSSVIQMTRAQHEAQAYKDYAQSLQTENAALRDTYLSSYDEDEIRSIALAMGMVPIKEVTHIKMHVTIPEAEPEMTPWENIRSFLVGLFA